MTSYGNSEPAPYQPFVDYKNGNVYEKDTELYWKTLNSVIETYPDHPESKFRDSDRMRRLHRRSLKVKKQRL